MVTLQNAPALVQVAEADASMVLPVYAVQIVAIPLLVSTVQLAVTVPVRASNTGYTVAPEVFLM